MNIFALPKVRIQRKQKSFERRCQDWTKLFDGLTNLEAIAFGRASTEDIAKAELDRVRIESIKARTENSRLQAELTKLRAQKMGNEVTQAEQKAEKLELEILKLRHELAARGIIKSENFQEPQY